MALDARSIVDSQGTDREILARLMRENRSVVAEKS
jgi:hypothetical protein